MSIIHSNTDISMPVVLSDWCFMHTKDFYHFFELIELSVTNTVGLISPRYLGLVTLK